jgi:hypothetical protein
VPVHFSQELRKDSCEYAEVNSYHSIVASAP